MGTSLWQCFAEGSVGEGKEPFVKRCLMGGQVLGVKERKNPQELG